MTSIGAIVPPELFANILSFVGDEVRLCPREDPTDRREEMKHLSACALTCVYWAQLTRPHMFSEPVLRSADDLHRLHSFLRASVSERIEPIGRFIRRPSVFYKLGDHLWFYHLGRLKASGAHELLGMTLHINGPVPPEFMFSNTQRPILHPLFYSSPRVLPIPTNLNLDLYVENLHFTTPAILFNLLQDCLLLHPQSIYCEGLTWDDSLTIASPSSIGFTIASRQDYVTTSGCTNSALVAAMVQSISYTPNSHRRPVPQLCSTDSSHLLDVMCATQGATPGEFRMHSFPRAYLNRGQVHPRLQTIEGTVYFYATIARVLGIENSVGRDLYLGWTSTFNGTAFQFYGVASRDGLDTQIHYMARIVVDLRSFGSHNQFMVGMRAVDWVRFVHSTRKFPHLREIDIVLYDWPYGQGSRESLAELVAHLLEVSPELSSIPKLYSDDTRAGDVGWTSIELETVLKEIDMTRQVRFLDKNSYECINNAIFKGLRVNSVIDSSSYTITSRPFVWDLRDPPPEFASQPSSQDPRHPSELTAIIPPDHYLEICCAQLPWKVTVTHLDTGRFNFVTVRDVMRTLYEALRPQISQAELQSVCGGNAHRREQVEAAYKQRITRSKSPEEKRTKGIRRVDLLGGDTVFAGLVAAKSKTNPRIPTLDLHISSAVQTNA